MALKAITLRLDEEEYEQLKAYLEEFGDPDINVAYVVRSYIRDLNRSLPFLLNSGWDLKNYFGMLGSWLKQFGSLGQITGFCCIRCGLDGLVDFLELHACGVARDFLGLLANLLQVFLGLSFVARFGGFQGSLGGIQGQADELDHAARVFSGMGNGNST